MLQILLTLILCKSGLMTHLLGLARVLAKRDVKVAVAAGIDRLNQAVALLKGRGVPLEAYFMI